MNEQQLSELIFREIDGEISESEKKSLQDTVAKNPHARILYKQIMDSTDFIDNLPGVEPPPELREKIRDSIDVNRYRSTETVPKKGWVNNRWSSRPMVKIAYSFAIGILAGVIITSSLFISFDDDLTVETQNLTGTIGKRAGSGLNILEEFPIDLPQINGRILLKHDGQFYGLEIDLQAREAFEIVLFNLENKVDIQRFEPRQTRDVRFEYFNQSAKLFAENGKLHSVLYFEKKNNTPDMFDLGLIISDKILYRHAFSNRPEVK